MPKLIDRDKRRQIIAFAAMRIIARHGLDTVTYANVAQEVHLAIGSVRHLFPSRQSLIEGALKATKQAMRERLFAHAEKLKDSPPAQRKKVVIDLLCEFLPLDESRRLEGQVWLNFMAAQVSDKNLQSEAKQLYRDIRKVFDTIIDAGQKSGAISPKVNREIEALRLHSLIDGLTLMMLHGPGFIQANDAREAIALHLANLQTVALQHAKKHSSHSRV